MEVKEGDRGENETAGDSYQDLGVDAPAAAMSRGQLNRQHQLSLQLQPQHQQHHHNQHQQQQQQQQQHHQSQTPKATLRPHKSTAVSSCSAELSKPTQQDKSESAQTEDQARLEPAKPSCALSNAVLDSSRGDLSPLCSHPQTSRPETSSAGPEPESKQTEEVKLMKQTSTCSAETSTIPTQAASQTLTSSPLATPYRSAHLSYTTTYQHGPMYQPQSPVLVLPPATLQNAHFPHMQMPYLPAGGCPSHHRASFIEHYACCDQDLQQKYHNSVAYFWAYQQDLMRSQEFNQHICHPSHQFYLPRPVCGPTYTLSTWPTASYLSTPLTFLEQTSAPVTSVGQFYLAPPFPHSATSTDQLKYCSLYADQLLSSLPIGSTPAKTRQAYGMDKVWKEEFEQLFSQTVSNVHWNLSELESNPVIFDSPTIIGYKGHYLIDLSRAPHFDQQRQQESVDFDLPDETDRDRPSSCESRSEENSQPNNIHTRFGIDGESIGNEQEESDCESGGSQIIPLASSGADSGLGSEVNGHDTDSKSTSSSSTMSSSNSCPIKVTLEEASTDEPGQVGSESICTPRLDQKAQHRQLPQQTPTKFRMFIDSAKVRFCCDNCGHGWTSMKGRVVFWYELFEIVNQPSLVMTAQPANQIIGFCAYKLFGQQCDICKIEDRFERPMWYPEEVVKVLNNLYSKVGQVYFGFKAPAIDKQRRAGKPKTSHNSSLCQACQDGLCTDVARYFSTLR